MLGLIKESYNKKTRQREEIIGCSGITTILSDPMGRGGFVTSSPDKAVVM